MRPQSLIDLLAPPLCVACRRSVPGGLRLCPSCREELAALPPARYNAVAYEGVAKQLVIALKRGGQVALAAELAAQILARNAERLEGAEWIVPVPAHPARSRRRGYSPSLLIARELAKLTGARCVDCLVRERDRPPQSELSRSDRLGMPAGHIRVSERALRRRRIDPAESLPTNVVVCDDVTTTGITLEICAQAICERQPEAGRRPLSAVVFAAA
jgi:predicted amidophosphoribosyltransferase